MSDPTKTPPRRSRSRAEVQQAYDDLPRGQATSPKEKEDRSRRARELRGATADLTAERAAQSLATAGVSMQKALSAVSEELATSLNQLTLVKENIALEAEELERLHGAHTVAEHLDVLKAEHDEQAAELADDIALQRSKWVEERVRIIKEDDLFKNELKTRREREEADHKYAFEQARKQREDSFAEDMRLKRAVERDRGEAQEKIWAAREEAIKAQENDITELRKQVVEFPQRLEAEAGKRVGMATGAMRKDHEHEVALLKHAAQSALALAESEKKSLTEALTREKALTETLRVELASANAKNTEIATKALDSTSSREALTTLQASLKDGGNNGGARKSS